MLLGYMTHKALLKVMHNLILEMSIMLGPVCFTVVGGTPLIMLKNCSSIA